MKYKICVSGSSKLSICSEGAVEKAQKLGCEIIRQGGILLTGATTGLPDEAAKGAKKEKGMVFGFSPASSHKEHISKYHLPTENYDVIFFSGYDYSGRNTLLVDISDAVIIICGRIGTLNEFTIAFEKKKAIGVLTETGGISSEINHIIEIAKRGRGKIIYDSNPREIVRKVIAKIKEEYKG